MASANSPHESADNSSSPPAKWKSDQHCVVGAAAEIAQVQQLLAGGVELAHEAIAEILRNQKWQNIVSVIKRLKRSGRDGQVRGGSGGRHSDVARGIHRDAGDAIVARAAKVGRVEQRAASGVELGDKPSPVEKN